MASQKTADPSATKRQLLILTGVAVLTEVALLVRSLHEGDPIAATCLVLAGYHAGYLVADRAESLPERTLALGTAVCLVAVGLLGIFWMWPLASLAAFLVSAAIQAWRRRLKPQASLTGTEKNAAKAIGMSAGGAGALSSWAFVGSFFALGLASTVLRPRAAATKSMNRVAELSVVSPSSSLLAWAELLHHAQYFAYVYVFWRRIEGLALPAVGSLFMVGWIGYFVAEAMFREHRRSFSPSLLAAGHALCALAIAGMAFANELVPIMGLWFLTGVGGGTAFMLSNGPQHPLRERFEDVGHVAGTVAAALVAAVTGSILGPIWLGACLAAGTCLLFIVYSLSQTGSRACA